MHEENKKLGTTTRAGQVVWIRFPWDQKPWESHPGLILGREGDYLRVVSGTSQEWHEGDEDDFVKVEDGCGLTKPTWFQVTEVYLIPESRVRKVVGDMPDGLHEEIRDRTEGL
jgi:hypothetical protein